MKLGRWCYEKRALVVAIWVLALVVVGVVSSAVGSDFGGDPEAPESESRTGFDILNEHFGGFGAGAPGTVVFRADQGVDDPAVVEGIQRVFDAADDADGISVTSPYGPFAFGQIAADGPNAGKIAFAQVEVSEDVSFADSSKIGKDLRRIADEVEAEVPGLQIEIGGEILAEFHPPESETIGLAFAIVVLIVSFGSVLAMGLPIAVALSGVGLGLMVSGLLSNVLVMPDFATTIGAMIGLGVGIDYALFIVTRYREGLHKGWDPETSTMAAMDTAGRAVVFAGITVVASLLGLLLIGLEFVAGLGVSAAVTVLITMLASTTLLPALLGFARLKVEITRYRALIAAGLVAVALLGVGLGLTPLLLGVPLAIVVMIAGLFIPWLKQQVPHREQKPMQESGWYKWSHLIQDRPWPFAIGGVALLLIVSLPVLGLRLGFSDEGNYPEESTTRQAYDLLTDGFGPGFNGPFVVATELSDPVADLAAFEAVADAIAADPGVAAVIGLPPAPPDLTAEALAAFLDVPVELAQFAIDTDQLPFCERDGPCPAPNTVLQRSNDDPSAALLRVVPATSPQSVETEELIKRLRSDVIPAATEGTSLAPAVTGFGPVSVDFSSYLGGRSLLFFGVVLLVSFVLLMAVFRSLLVPVKAVIMNMLSISGAYGIVVAIFQWGWFSDITQVEPGPIEPFIPMMMFAIVFGLSMDYEVFLLSRIKEEYERTGEPRNSVADGLASTARVISAAAAIMVVVFGSFLLEDGRVVKVFGTGLSVAVLLDATLVRMLLVPATMELLGKRNWWIPSWLDKVLPELNVEGAPDHDELVATRLAEVAAEEQAQPELVGATD